MIIRFGRVVCVVVACLGGGVGAAACDVWASLAQSEVFAGLRPDLIRTCCACLAANTTTNESATCSEARLENNVVTFDDDAVFGRPDDEDTDEDESVTIPCLCEDSRLSCQDALAEGDSILIPGACVDLVDAQAPCESACAGVLSFDTIQ
jgi:hypothetical protein